MISIIVVNHNANDFLGLLLESLARFSELDNKVVVIDNSTEPQPVHGHNVFHFPMPANIGHGRGLNHGVAKAVELFPKNPFVMFLDVDCHLLRHRWESKFMSKMKEFQLVGGRGVPAKPIRPACMFMHQKIAKAADWADTPGYRGNRVTPAGYDVGIKAYYKLMADNVPVGFLERSPGRYETRNGEEFLIDGEPVVYHHWHGSHLTERQADFPDTDLTADKLRLFGRIPWRLP